MGGKELGGGFYGSRGHSSGASPSDRCPQRYYDRVQSGTLDRLQHRTGKRRTIAVHYRRKRQSDHKRVLSRQGNNRAIL